MTSTGYVHKAKETKKGMEMGSTNIKTEGVTKNMHVFF